MLPAASAPIPDDRAEPLPDPSPEPTRRVSHKPARVAGPARPAKAQRRAAAPRVLLCGRAATLAEALRSAEPGVRLVLAATAEEARERLAERAPGARVDLAVLDADLPGAEGLRLAEEIAASRRGRRPGLVLLRQPERRVSVAEASRAGLLDVLDAGGAARTAANRVAAALRRVEEAARRDEARRRERRRSRRLARRCEALESKCAEVESERQAISDQVEALCGDLVGAYQELSDRLDAAVCEPGLAPLSAAGGDALADLLADELGLEPVIRTTLEHLVSVAGATNAAIFLPASMDEYSLGGYVNHTCTTESAGMLLEHLADVVAPKLAAAAGPVHLTDNAQLAAWFDDDAAWLDDSEFLGIPCTLGGEEDEAEPECLAVVLLFRESDQPFDATTLTACETLGPVLADVLQRLIRVHHRTGYTSAEDELLDG